MKRKLCALFVAIALLISPTPTAMAATARPYGPVSWFWAAHYGGDRVYFAGQKWQMASQDNRTRFIWQAGALMLYRDNIIIWHTPLGKGNMLEFLSDGYIGIWQITCTCKGATSKLIWAVAGIGQIAYGMKIVVTAGRASVYEQMGAGDLWWEVYRWQVGFFGHITSKEGIK